MIHGAYKHHFFHLSNASYGTHFTQVKTPFVTAVNVNTRAHSSWGKMSSYIESNKIYDNNACLI